jgi:hypothetical protein
MAGSIPDDIIEIFIELIFPTALCFWGNSASNINEYQEYFLGVKAAGE